MIGNEDATIHKSLHNADFSYIILHFPFNSRPLIKDKCEEWIALRVNIEGRASIKYNDKGELREWHYIYKSGRRYKMGLAVWASPALSIVSGKPRRMKLS